MSVIFQKAIENEAQIKLEKKEKTMDLSKALWAKKDDDQGKGEWLPLLQHLEDTSRVCGFLWDHWLCDGQRKIIAGDHDLDVGRQVMFFLGAIHDLGKATPAFQIKGYYSRPL
ncbi:MAG: hypothetical protein LUD07_13725 [Clostridiales bacterium]|nr:hypothetical protein [Clostridiales bacterium]